MSLYRYAYQSSGTATKDEHTPPSGSTFDTAVLGLTDIRFYYKLSEGSGTDMYDAAGSNDGTYAGAPTLTAAGPTTDGDYGATFNGTDQYGYVSHDSAFNFGTSDMTIGAFIKDASWPSASSWVVAHHGDGDSGTWEMYQRDTVVNMATRGPGGSPTIYSTTGLDDGAWHLVGFSADRDGNLQWYDNGAASGSPVSISASSATALDFTGTLWVGRRQSAGYSSASIARVFGCGSLLSSGDWSTLYAAR
ncbi:MAG TPA: hypothetical protein VMW94_09395 [Actinomycetes bacterium]|nr:hypothetical protein [Actinomycetes bacterium]